MKELAVDIIVRTFFMNLNVRSIFLALPKLTLRRSRPVYIRARGRINEASASTIVTKEVGTVNKNPSRVETCVTRETVIPLRAGLSVPNISTMTGLRLIESKPQTRKIEQVIVVKSVGNILLPAPFHCLVTRCSKNSLHLPKKGMFACTKLPTLRQQPNVPSEPKNVRLMWFINGAKEGNCRC